MCRRIVLCVVLLVFGINGFSHGRTLVLSPNVKPTKQSSSHSTDFANTFIIFSESDDGCIIGNTSVLVIRDRLNNNTTTLNYDSIKDNICIPFSEGIEDAFGTFTIDPSAFSIDTKNFTSASLKVSISVHDLITGQDIPVDIDLVWTGVGDISYFNTVTTLTRANTYRERDISSREIRDTQLSGSISDLLPNVFFNLPYLGGGAIAHDEDSQDVITK